MFARFLSQFVFACLFGSFILTASASPVPAQRAAAKEPDDTCPGFQRPISADADDEKPSSKLDKAARKFAGENGISVERKNDKFVFTLKAGGDVQLFTTAATEAGLKSAAVKLKKLVEEKVAELEKKFDVLFTTDGEVVEKQWVKNDKGEWERGNDVLARAPRLDELYGIEAAIYRAQPSHKGKDHERGIKFYFLTDDLTKGERPLATWRADRNGRPAIHYFPGATDGRPVLERDAPFDPARSLGHAYGSIEALTSHEIAHNHQHRIGWWSDLEKDELTKYGFRDCGLDKEGNRILAVETTSKDGKGNAIFYRSNEKTGLYTACDETGQEIANEPEITKSAVRKIAKHRPMTYYFPSPSETYAEGVMVYRLGGVYRESLLKENPALYEVVKRLDQLEIDAAYGVDVEYEYRQGYDQWGNQVWYQVEKSRASRYIRSAEGRPVKNTKANVDAVKKFEKKARST